MVMIKKGKKIKKLKKSKDDKLAVDVLVGLIGRVELRVRKALAAKLAVEKKAHHELVKVLAVDEFEVAAPILEKSSVLTDKDLVGVVGTASAAHRLAVAGRDVVGKKVSSALVASSDMEAIFALLENDGAVISKKTMRQLVQMAKHDKKMQPSLLGRKELVKNMAVELYWWVGKDLRDAVLGRFDIDKKTLDRALEQTIGEIIRDDNPEHLEEMEEIVSLMQRMGKISSYLLIESLRRKHLPMFASMFSKMTKLRPDAVRALISAPGGESLSLICRAAGIKKSAFASIFLLSRGARKDEQIVDPKELAHALSYYDSIKDSSARRIARQWQEDPTFLLRSNGSMIINR